MSRPHDAGEVEVRVPGDKSITHRALILSAIASGTSLLTGLLPGEDARSTAAALRALGIPIPELPADGAVFRRVQTDPHDETPVRQFKLVPAAGAQRKKDEGRQEPAQDGVLHWKPPNQSDAVL